MTTLSGKIALAAGLWLGIAAPTAQGALVTLSCGAVGIELEVCREGAEAWAAQRGHRARVVSTPNSATDRLALYQQLLAAGSADIDVFQVDIVWPAFLHAHFVDLAAQVPAGRLDQQFTALVRGNTVDGRLVALPWFVDAGLLYYRRDLLERHGLPVPQTWDELTATARLVQERERAAGGPRLWGYVWQGRAYEGLTCNALEWVYSSGGGRIIDSASKVTIDNPRAAAAVQRAAGWVATISPPGVLNYDEEQSRGLFQSGRALFMRNWPYAWALANGPQSPVRGKVGVAPLPRGAGGRHTGTLGGWQLAVSRYSRVQPEAVDLVLYLTSREEQRRRALVAGYNPTWRGLYDDPELVAGNPLLAVLRQVLDDAVMRPATETGRGYNQVSNAFWSAVHAALSGRAEADDELARLAGRLERLGERGRW